MGDTFLHSPLIAAMAASALSFFVSWLFRRDTTVRSSAMETARVADLERRIRILEVDTVTRRDFDSLKERVNEIREDVREIRKAVDAAK